MKKAVLIYAGTTEGRQLAERLSEADVSCDVRVATEYGSLVMPNLAHVSVSVGRLDTEQMRALAGEAGIAAVVDATHPFATEVSENIRESVAGLDVPYFRLSRRTASGEDAAACRCADAASLAKALSATEGNILLTTGSKELAAFCAERDLAERLFVRVLPAEESLAACRAQGIRGRQIIAMQGPFSKEMNLALIRAYHIRHLVTKESGKSGGFPEKLEAAREAGIPVYVIQNPEVRQEKKPFRFREVLAELGRILGEDIPLRPKLSFSLIGIGMSPQTLTREAAHALGEADILFGAPRMLEGLANGRESYPYYRSKEILPVLCKKEEQCDDAELRVAILFSGDAGFYSGAQKMKAGLNKNGYREIRIFPGVSSVCALAAALGVSWQDAKILSIHGRTGTDAGTWQAQLLHAVGTHTKTFLLVSGAEDVGTVGELLAAAGFGVCELICGYQLGYPDEEILRMRAEEASGRGIAGEGLFTCLIENPAARPARVTPGLPDDAFVRGRIPMTKEEVRAVALCKLGLTEDAVVYDVGSGTGSIAVECALRSPGIRVYAIEQKEDAQKLLRQNLEKFHLHNVTPVDGSAPEALETLPVPTHVFIGGSGGKLSGILAAAWTKNPHARIVVSAVSLETIAQLSEIQKNFVPPEGFSLGCKTVQLQVSRAREAGSYHLMQAENPVYLSILELTI